MQSNGIAAPGQNLGGFIEDESGQGIVEYGMIVAFVAALIVAIWKFLGPAITNLFLKAENSMNEAPG